MQPEEGRTEQHEAELTTATIGRRGCCHCRCCCHGKLVGTCTAGPVRASGSGAETRGPQCLSLQSVLVQHEEKIKKTAVVGFLSG